MRLWCFPNHRALDIEMDPARFPAIDVLTVLLWSDTGVLFNSACCTPYLTTADGNKSRGIVSVVMGRPLWPCEVADCIIFESI